MSKQCQGAPCHVRKKCQHERRFWNHGFNWVGKYTFGSFHCAPPNQWFVQFKHEYAWPIQIWQTPQDFEHQYRHYQQHRKSIRKLCGTANNKPKQFKSFAMKCFQPEYMSEFVEYPMEYFLTTWKHHTNQHNSAVPGYCAKTIDRLSRCYKFIVKVLISDWQNNDWQFGSFFFFCNDKDVWLEIERELQEVFKYEHFLPCPWTGHSYVY